MTHHNRFAGTTGRRALTGAAFALAFAGSALAAPAAGTIDGVAQDAEQHAVAGVAMQLKGADGTVVARATTDKAGHFAFTGIAPGDYTVAASKSGTGTGTTSVTLAADAGISAEVTLLAQAEQPTEEVTVTAQRLNLAQIGIEPQVGASTYSFSSDAIQNLPGGENAPLSEVLIHAPGVNYDSSNNNGLHVRNEHLDVQYRINGVILPEGISYFGQGLSPRFADSIQLITGTLPAEYGLRTAGIADIQTKSGLFAPGGSVGLYGGSYDTLQPSFEYGGSYGRYNYYIAADHLSSSHGIEGPTPSYNAIHDDTQQLHAFVYLDKIVNEASKITFIGGTFQGQFQIPNTPGQTTSFLAGPPTTCGNAGVGGACGAPTPLDGTVRGLTTYDSGMLTEHQVESSSYALFSYLRSEQDFDFQISPFSKFGTLSYHPDTLGDLFFNGISQTAYRQSLANGVQADGSYRIRSDHTLRAGVFIQEERALANTTSLVLPINACLGAPDSTTAGCPLTGVGSFSPTPISAVDDHAKTGWLYGTYIQDEYRVTPTITLNYGARFDLVDEYTQEDQISPRVNAVWKPTDSTTVHAGYARYFTPPPFELVSTASLGTFAGTSASCVPNTCIDSPVKSERSHYFDAGVVQEVLPGLKVGVDAYYKYARNLLDEGQFGAPVILTPFNYHVAFNRGVELTTSYEKGPFSYYGNLAIAEQKAEGITSAQFNFSATAANVGTPGMGCPLSDLQYAAQNLVNTDHSQRMTASTGVSYLWRGTRYSADVIAGTGLRDAPNGECLNEGTVPSYEQVNLGVSHKFDLPYGGPLEVRLDIINVLDEVYLIRSSTGVGVFSSQYGPRRSFFVGLKKEF